jgi:hypothetical protein
MALSLKDKGNINAELVDGIDSTAFMLASALSDAAYDASWNGDTTHVPTKNAIYDKIETIVGGSVPWSAIPASMIPSADNTYDIGSSSYKWKDGYFSGTVNVGGNINLDGTLSSDVAAGTGKNIIYGTMGGNDFYRIRAGGASNDGWLEIATADDGNEPILVRQYTGTFATITRTLTLLDASGNSLFPGNIYEGGTALSSKYAAKSHPHSYLPLSGGSMTGAIVSTSSFNFGSTFGGTGLYMGNGDAATQAVCNLDIQSWNGIGIKGMAGNPYGDGTRTIWPHARYGTITTKGQIYAGDPNGLVYHAANKTSWTARSDFSGSIGSGGRLNFNSASEYCFSPCTEGGQYISIQTGTAATGYNSRTCIHNTTANTYSYFIGWRYLT